MTLPMTVALAFALSMDAFAAALGRGAALRCTGLGANLLEAARIGAVLGAFELATPLLGWSLGLAFSSQITAWDHWVAFALLVVVGGRMIWETLGDDPAEAAEPGQDETAPATPGRASIAALLLTGLATSIDAAAVGITLAFISADMVTTCTAIGLVTFGMAFGGALAGRVAGNLLGAWAERLGGVALIAIGARILFEHLSGAA
jgi:putative Mn2+ efflux pump MntP